MDYKGAVRETFVMVDEPGYKFDLLGYKVFINKYGFRWHKKRKRPYTVHGLTWRKWPPWFKRWERALPGIDE